MSVNRNACNAPMLEFREPPSEYTELCFLRGTIWACNIIQLLYVFCTDLRANSDYSLYSINWLIFITEIVCLLSSTNLARNIIQRILSL
jgi:hypothetical protein